MSTQKNLNKKIFVLLLLLTATVVAQVQGTKKKYIRIGSLQSHFTAYGSERAWTGGSKPYYAGLRWPADYPFTDNAVIKRTWLAARDFTDVNGKHWDQYGIYFATDYVGQSLFPVKMEEYARFSPPVVKVNEVDITKPYRKDVDALKPSLKADRQLVNVVNTSLGLTMKRTIYAFSQQYHDNYFIKEFVFTNTGNVDYDDDIELNQPLKGIYISWGTRYSVCREGAYNIGGGQSWGEHSWVTRRGETYPQNYTTEIDESTPIASLDWLRAGFSWAGQFDFNDFDNIGAPDVNHTGRLTAPQFAGIAALHVDKAASDPGDDPYQPSVLGWQAGDTYPSLGDISDPKPMTELYDMLSGHPYQGKGGTQRYDEIHLRSITDPADPWTFHNDRGGTNVWIVYGPFDLNPGDSIRIVEAEGVNGLNREMCETIGRRWKKAYDNASDKGPFELPDGTTTQNKDYFKNSWVYTGKDSIMLTFSRAKRNFDAGFEIPQPPLPPESFEVNSGGDHIGLKWLPSPDENQPDFAGYRIFRGVGKPDTSYTQVFACGKGTDHPDIVHEWEDTSPVRGFSYYYYIVSFNDGSNNTSGKTNPTGQLHSGRFYTRTTDPAYLQRKPGETLSGIRIVPNPFNIKAREFNYPKEPDKITFLNIPAYCTIKIYTERGDLIATLQHTNGSGLHAWNAITDARQIVASGLYIAYFMVTKDFYDSSGKLLYKKGESTYKKFVIIR